jgi:hypothetical protein
MIIVSGVLFLLLMGLYWLRERRFWAEMRRVNALIASEPAPSPPSSSAVHKKAA